jgi:hypothetical protein
VGAAGNADTFVLDANGQLTTVLDDGACDELDGSQGQDWFLAGSGDDTDWQSGETVSS